MAARKLGASWWADFRFNFRRYRKRAPLNTKGGAQAYETFLRGELAKRGSLEHLRPKPREAKPVTFGEFTERWMRDYVATNNKASERYAKKCMFGAHLVPAFGTQTLAEVTSARVEQYKAEKIRAGLAPKSVNNQLTMLRMCLRCAVEWGELDHLPVIRCLRTPPPHYRVLSIDEERALLAAAPVGERWHTMILLALRTGMRYCEIGALHWEDVDLGPEPRLTVRRAVVRRVFDTTKTNRVRYVPLPRDAAEALARFPREGALVFMAHGRDVAHYEARDALTRITRCAGIPRHGWHVFRHTYASRLVMAGESLQAGQQLLGHTTIAMTARYAHLAPEFLRTTVALLERPCRVPEVWAEGGQSTSLAPALPTSTSDASPTTWPNKAKSATEGDALCLVVREGFEPSDDIAAEHDTSGLPLC